MSEQPFTRDQLPGTQGAEEFRPLKLKVTCIHLRHKLMYVDEMQATPGLVDDQSDTRIYFCTRSQEQLGPDDAPVHPAACCAGRECCKIV